LLKIRRVSAVLIAAVTGFAAAVMIIGTALPGSSGFCIRFGGRTFGLSLLRRGLFFLLLGRLLFLRLRLRGAF